MRPDGRGTPPPKSSSDPVPVAELVEPPIVAEAVANPVVQPPQKPTYLPGLVCPQCDGQSIRNGAQPWYLGTIGLMLVKPVICSQCGHQFDARKPDADFGRRMRNLALVINGVGAAGILAIVGLLGFAIYMTFD